jgi:hypothetical protein
MFYSVKYRYPKEWFWKTLKNVKGDGILEVGGNARFFILADETRVELPVICEFRFSPKRFEMIKRNMEAQVGQAIPVTQ